MNSCVLDASALLAYLLEEPGYEAIAGLLDRAVINAVNLAEVVAKLIDKGATEIQARQTIHNLRINILPFDEVLAFQSAALRSATKEAGLSLGDRACLATARRLGVPALTTDRQWSRLRVGVRVQVVR